MDFAFGGLAVASTVNNTLAENSIPGSNIRLGRVG